MKEKIKDKSKRLLVSVGLSVASGFLAGTASALLLSSLRLATAYREQNSWLVFLLPVAGFFVGWWYFHFGKELDAGNSLVIDVIHQPQNKLPLRMAPFVLVGTILTHTFGGSAGREGTAVQMGASLAGKLGDVFRVGRANRRVLLVAGMGAGFGSAIGTPWAGMLFGLEVLSIGRFQSFALFECFIASFVGYFTVGLWGVKHTEYLPPVIPDLSFQLVVAVTFSAIAFGLTARLFTQVVHFVEFQVKRFISYPPLRPLVGGVILVGLFWLEGTYRYCGLGLGVIRESLQGNSALSDPFLKTLFTALTVGTGFKGGEFIPLVFIGSTLGSFLGVLLKIGGGFLAALGFSAVFGAAANTPIACAVMGMEIFGIGFAPYLFIACFLSYLCSGQQGIYKTQRALSSKHGFLIKFYQRFLRNR